MCDTSWLWLWGWSFYSRLNNLYVFWRWKAFWVWKCTCPLEAVMTSVRPESERMRLVKLFTTHFPRETHSCCSCANPCLTPVSFINLIMCSSIRSGKIQGRETHRSLPERQVSLGSLERRDWPEPQERWCFSSHWMLLGQLRSAL